MLLASSLLIFQRLRHQPQALSVVLHPRKVKRRRKDFREGMCIRNRRVPGTQKPCCQAWLLTSPSIWCRPACQRRRNTQWQMWNNVWYSFQYWQLFVTFWFTNSTNKRTGSSITTNSFAVGGAFNRCSFLLFWKFIFKGDLVDKAIQHFTLDLLPYFIEEYSIYKLTYFLLLEIADTLSLWSVILDTWIYIEDQTSLLLPLILLSIIIAMILPRTPCDM